ncbi:MAG: hypothetical protein LQ349_007096 [Xanthoria aureola]|nr:MAG: hypothetical protein LQ349_007096 [Xanthoria aureola]
MAPNISITWLWSILLILFAIHVPVANAVSQSLCSSFNTGANGDDVTYDYQSAGRCFDNCKAQYAFAIVKGKSCWCSDYAPGDTTSLGSCSSPCPGYPFEQCGSDAFFGYIAIGKAPVGTIGASQSQSSTSSPPEVSTSISEVVSSPASQRLTFTSFSSPVRPSPSTSVTAGKQPTIKISFGVPSSINQLSIPASSSTFTILTPSVQTPPTPNPVTVQQTVTASPSVQVSLVSITPSTILDTTTETTTTATPVRPTTSYVPISVTETTTNAPAPAPTTSSVPASSSSEEPSPKSTWTPTPVTSVMTVTGQIKTITITPTIPPNGAVVAQPSRDGGFMSHPGKVAGLFVGIAVIICLLAAALIWFFIRRNRNAEAEAMASTAGGETPQRRQSKMSTIGLLGGTRRTNKRRSVPKIQTSGWGPGNSMEKSPVDTPVDYSRTSYPRVVDQRLEPAALWNPLQDNGSHVSIQSFRDDQDYSRRMLRVGDPGGSYG